MLGNKLIFCRCFGMVIGYDMQFYIKIIDLIQMIIDPKGKGSKRKKLNFGKNAKNWHNSKTTRVRYFYKKFKNCLVKTFQKTVSTFLI